MKQLRALVVGGNGFVGSHLVDRLLSDGWHVSILHKYEQRRFGSTPACVKQFRGDLSQESLVEEALEGIDIVFHLLWTTTAIHEVANRDPAADIQANLLPTVRFINACLQAGVQRLVFTSSGGTVYGVAQVLPLLETHPKKPLNAYGVSKLAVETYLQMFRHLHGLDYAILRPSVPYGPGQNPLARQGAPAVFTYHVAHGLPISIWGDGCITRDYFYIDDLTEALLAAAQRPLVEQRIFNIGGGQEISLTQLITAVEQTVGKKANVLYKPARNFDVPRLVLDTGQAREILQWQPQMSLEDGLRKTWEWISQYVPGPA